MSKLILNRSVAGYDAGKVFDLEEDFKGKVPLALQAHLSPFRAKVEPETVDVEAIKEEAEKESREHLAEIHEKVLGKAPHHRASLDKIKEDIIEALPETEEE